MRVLVTDDSAFMRRAVCTMLNADPDIEVAGVAHNGKEAVELAKTLKPDVITLDIEMPEMDGLTALRHIMRTAPTQVLMLSSLTTEGSTASLQALKLGAADVLAKDQSQFSTNMSKLQAKLITTVKELAKSNPHKNKSAAATPDKVELPRFRPTQFDLVCIGSSTGGPPVLETILGALPATTQPPVVVAQHMPEVFTRSMADRLNKLCPLKVVHVENVEPIESGHIYLARGGKHMQIHKSAAGKLEARVGTEPADAIYRPSVDALFSSAAKATAARTLGVVLTGIGADGTLGAKDIHAAGGIILAQDQATSVVYGMPKSVAEAGVTTASLPPVQIAQALANLARAAAA
ncbi:MAG: chemotaxis response regulator protein-glutamate methylesterase [Phycisphaerales bacterium]